VTRASRVDVRDVVGIARWTPAAGSPPVRPMALVRSTFLGVAARTLPEWAGNLEPSTSPGGGHVTFAAQFAGGRTMQLCR